MFYLDTNKYTCKVGGSTFLIRIHFKQNANWQGTVQWLETNKEVPFRSTLELMFLLNEAIDQTITSNDDLDFRSWENIEPENYYSEDK